MVAAVAAFALGRHDATEAAGAARGRGGRAAFHAARHDRRSGSRSRLRSRDRSCSPSSARVAATASRTAPELVALARRGTTVLAIDAGAGSADERKTFARDELAGAVPFLADPGSRVSQRYRASATPTVYVLRADGRIAAAWVGEASPSRFESALTAARG